MFSVTRRKEEENKKPVTKNGVPVTEIEKSIMERRGEDSFGPTIGPVKKIPRKKIPEKLSQPPSEEKSIPPENKLPAEKIQNYAEGLCEHFPVACPTCKKRGKIDSPCYSACGLEIYSPASLGTLRDFRIYAV